MKGKEIARGRRIIEKLVIKAKGRDIIQWKQNGHNAISDTSGRCLSCDMKDTEYIARSEEGNNKHV